MNIRGKRAQAESLDMSGYIVIGLGFGAVIGLLVGNMIPGAGIGLCFGLLIKIFAEM